MKPKFQQIDLGGEESILAFKYRKPSFEAPWHFHPEHELNYVEESSGTKFIGDYVGSYGPGELVLLRSNLPHCWKNQVQDGTEAVSHVVLWNKDVYARVPELSPLFAMLKTASRGIVFELEDTGPLVPTIKELAELKGHALYLRFLSFLMQLTACRYRTLSEASFMDHLPAEFGSRMSKIHDFVEVNYQRKIYLRELADLINLSEQSFSRFFSKMMGRPFFTFLNEYRINVASRMLIDTDWSIAEIGFRCGYESLPFFHKQFTKFKGISPARYRRRYAASKQL